jgi:hypothetical protein
MAIENSPQDFKYQSTLGGLLYLWCCAMMLLFWPIGDLRVSPISGHWGSFLLLDLPYRLFLLGSGCLILNGASDVQILDDEFRFRRLFNSNSVPLKSITRVRRVWLPPSLYVRIEYAGKCYRLIFFPGEFRLGPSIPPVVRFLREVCRETQSG